MLMGGGSLLLMDVSSLVLMDGSGLVNGNRSPRRLWKKAWKF